MVLYINVINYITILCEIYNLYTLDIP